MRRIAEIIVHCSATRPEWMDGKPTADKVDEIRRWHVEDRGWNDIGYHYVIDRDGGVLPGRPVEQVGAHTKGHNAGTIGVCLIGGHGSSAKDSFGANFTPEQDTALRRFIGDMFRQHGELKVSGHNEYAAKACPGFPVGRWLSMLPPEPTKTHSPAPAAPKSPWAGILAAILAFFTKGKIK